MSHLPDPFITARFNNVQGTVMSPASKLDLAGYINQFGNLIFGTLKQEYFFNQYNILKRQHLAWLINSPFDNFKEVQPVQFYMHMIHEAQKTSTWRWPSLINNIDQFQWVNGNSRLFATGITKQDLSELPAYLILQNFSTPIDTYLDDPILVNDDKILHDVLKVGYDDDPWVPHCELILNYNVNNGQETLGLAKIKDPEDFTDHNTAGESFLAEFVDWRNKYGRRPTLKIYTNWPELVSNTYDAWKIQIVGDVNEIKQTIYHSAHLEKHVRTLHDQSNNEDHTLLIVEPRVIDVAELLFWVNCKHTAFIASDWSFALYRRDLNYSNTFVNLSYIKIQ